MTSRADKMLRMALEANGQRRSPLPAPAPETTRPQGLQPRRRGPEPDPQGRVISEPITLGVPPGPVVNNNFQGETNSADSRQRTAAWVEQLNNDAISVVSSSVAPGSEPPDWFMNEEQLPIIVSELIEPSQPTAVPVPLSTVASASGLNHENPTPAVPAASPAASGWNITELSTLPVKTPEVLHNAITSPSTTHWNVEGIAVAGTKLPVKRALFTANGLVLSNVGSASPASRHGPQSPENRNIDFDDPDSSFNLSANEIPASPGIIRTQNEDFLPDQSNGETTPTPTQSDEVTPTQTQKKRRVPSRPNTRKRVVNSSTWATEKAKKAFNAGIQHVTPKGYLRKARKMGAGCKSNCRICKKRITVEERGDIFQNFWNLGSVHRKRDFITRSVTTKKPATCSTIPSRAKKTSRRYSLTVIGTNEKYFVCKTMFLHTLGIPDCWVETSLKKCQGGVGQSPDKRGKHGNRKNRVPESTLDTVRRHINMFSRVPSHYTREKSKREYLEPHIKSVENMYKIYTNWARQEKIEKLASASMYRKVFNREFNLGFFMPRKDQCEMCNKWKNAKNQVERRGMVQEYSTHIQNKKLVYKLKKEDKGSVSETKCVACFDLQKVLICPRSETSLFFYKNKLSLYNFTVFDLRLKEGHCYLWTEVDAMKGSNEIGSNLYHFIQTKVEQGVKEFTFWSDSPTGQNRNRMVFSMFMLAAAKSKLKITHRFLESGHSYSEADSMHARIESEAERKEIFIPEEWITLIEGAKKEGKKYIINKLRNENVSDLHYLVDRQNWERNTNNEQVFWSKVREVVVNGNTPNYVYYRYNFSENLKTVVVTMKDGSELDLSKFSPPQAYQSRFPLSAKKKKDIIELCNKKAIPSKYHPVFKQYLDV